jgi:putative redox protein
MNNALDHYIRAMATIETFYLGELRCESEHVKTGSRLITDAPVDNCGKGSTFSPTDLLATALLNCMITVMGIHANEQDWPFKVLKSSAVKKMGINPRRVVEVEIEIRIDGSSLDSKMREELTLKGLNCPVAKSLSAELRQTVNIGYSE